MNCDFAPTTFGGHRAAFEMRGDSMAPRFRSRDLLLIDTADRAPADGGIFLVWFEDSGDYAVRRAVLKWGQLELSCENPDFANPALFDLTEIEIAGRVCGVWRKGGI